MSVQEVCSGSFFKPYLFLQAQVHMPAKGSKGIVMRTNTCFRPDSFRPNSNYLINRSNITLQHHSQHQDHHEQIVKIGQLTIYPEKYDARAHNHSLHLTASEFRVLLLMAKRANRVVTRDELKQCLRVDQETSSDRALDNTVSRLRQKIQPLQLRINAVRSIGYELHDMLDATNGTAPSHTSPPPSTKPAS